MSSTSRLAVALSAIFFVSCAGDVKRDPGFKRLWIGYSALEEHRALAVCGDPDRMWVAGAVGGASTSEAARQGALEACGKRRAERRMKPPCRLYASGDKVVWTD